MQPKSHPLESVGEACREDLQLFLPGQRRWGMQRELEQRQVRSTGQMQRKILGAWAW